MTVELERKDGILAYASSTDGPDPPPAVSDLEVLQGFFSFWDEASNFSDPVSDTFLNCRNFAYSHNFSIPHYFYQSISKLWRSPIQLISNGKNVLEVGGRKLGLLL